jgi:hypothetical protein
MNASGDKSPRCGIPGSIWPPVSIYVPVMLLMRYANASKPCVSTAAMRSLAKGGRLSGIPVSPR